MLKVLKITKSTKFAKNIKKIEIAKKSVKIYKNKEKI